MTTVAVKCRNGHPVPSGMTYCGACGTRVGGANVPDLVDRENARSPFGMRFRYVERRGRARRGAPVAPWAVMRSRRQTRWLVPLVLILGMALGAGGAVYGPAIAKRVHTAVARHPATSTHHRHAKGDRTAQHGRKTSAKHGH